MTFLEHGVNLKSDRDLRTVPRAFHVRLAKAAASRITLNLDGAPIISKSHTHTSHSETSRLLPRLYIF